MVRCRFGSTKWDRRGLVLTLTGPYLTRFFVLNMHFGIRSEITRITPMFCPCWSSEGFHRSGPAQTDGQKRDCIEHRILKISVEYCLSFIGKTVFLIKTYCRSTIFCSQKVTMVCFSLLASCEPSLFEPQWIIEGTIGLKQNRINRQTLPPPHPLLPLHPR